MHVTLRLELTSDDLTALAELAGVSFLSGDDIASELKGIIKRGLEPGIDLGTLYRITYYRENAEEECGYRLYTHVMQGPHWPPRPDKPRPRMYWDGRQLRSRGGAFTVDARRGILPTAQAEEPSHAARAS